jgi:hypothetical protein
MRLIPRRKWEENIKMDLREKRSRDSSVSITTRLRMDDQGSNPGRGWEFFSSSPRPDRLWGPPRLLSNG